MEFYSWDFFTVAAIVVIFIVGCTRSGFAAEGDGGDDKAPEEKYPIGDAMPMDQLIAEVRKDSGYEAPNLEGLSAEQSDIATLKDKDAARDLEMEIMREEREIQNILPGATDAETQAISRAMRNKSLGLLINAVQKASRTQEERAAADAAGDRLGIHMESDPTIETDVRTKDQQPAITKSPYQRGQDAVGFFKKLK